jgi:hypothetical protein
MEQVETDQKKRLSKNSINTALTALKSFFNRPGNACFDAFSYFREREEVRELLLA